MKIFISGELDKPVCDSFLVIRDKIEDTLKILNNRSYGSEILDICIVPIIATQSSLDAGFFKERQLLHRRDKSADYRFRINIEKFLNGDDETKRLLIIKVIIVSVRELGRKAKRDFDAMVLEEDILTVLEVSREEVDAIDMQ